MNENLQLGHLDPDTLTAFAEATLPAHERANTLDHLAVCPRCRTLVQLAMPPIEELQPIAAVPARDGLARWRWLWASATAVAAAGLAALLLLPAHQPPPPAIAKVQIAPLPEAMSSSQPPPPAKSPSSTQDHRVPPSAAAPPASKPEAPAGRLRSPAPKPETNSAYPSAGFPPPPPSAQPAAAPAMVARQTQKALQFRESQTPAPAPPPSRYVAESAATRAQAQNAAVSAPVVGLPSRLAIASRLAVGPRVVVADSAGTVFLSIDRGLHWDPVQPAWTGTVLRIEAARTGSDAPTSVFALLTSAGERWLSSDGRTWTHP